MTNLQASLLAFARAVLEPFPDSLPADYEIFEMAVEHGLLIGAQIVAPCEAGRDACACYAEDGPGLTTCYRRHPALIADDGADDG